MIKTSIRIPNKFNKVFCLGYYEINKNNLTIKSQIKC